MKKVLIIVTLAVIAFSVNAQVLNPVKWKFSVEKVGPYEAKITAEATIETGWNVYGLNIKEGGPIPTSFTIDKSRAFKIKGKAVEVTKAKVKQDKMFDMEVTYFQKKAVISQNVTFKKTPVTITGNITYMCCDDTQCLPPTDVDFSLTVK